MMTMIYPRNRTAVVLDNTFGIRHVVQIAVVDELVDIHEFDLVDNGTRAIHFYGERKNLSEAQSHRIGFTDWNCGIRDSGFHELDVASGWTIQFTWRAIDHIGIDESSLTDKPAERRCLKVSNLSDHWQDGSQCSSRGS